METVLMYALFAFGLLIIIKGADWFVDGATWLAEVTGMPKFIIGATIVSIATTLPEIIVSSMAAFEGFSILSSGVENAQILATERVGMAIGNSVGSVVCNTAMIMAISIMFMPTEIDRKKFGPRVVILAAAIAALVGFTVDGELSAKASIVLLVIFGMYIFENIKSTKTDLEDDYIDEKPQSDKKTIARNTVGIVIGSFCVVIGSRLIVNCGSEIAKSWGVSEAMIGVTMVAIGTSLPELVTAIVAVIKKQPSISIGNVIGANVIDIALIMPICTLIYSGSLPVSEQNIYLDFPVCLLVSVIALVPAVIGKKFYRWQGVLLLLVYIAYIVVAGLKPDWYLSLVTA